MIRLLIDMKGILISTLQKTLYFALGIIFGIVIFLIIYMLVSFIYKKKANHKLSDDALSLDHNEGYELSTTVLDNKEILEHVLTVYDLEYANKHIKVRLSAVKDLSLSIIDGYAKFYYPKSKNPMMEVSLEKMLNLIHETLDECEKTIFDILDSETFKLGWKTVSNVSNFISKIKNIFKKEEQHSKYLETDFKKIKISLILNKFELGKSKATSEVNQDEVKKYLLIDNFINDKIKTLLIHISEKADSVYGNKEQNHHEYEVKHDN